jgi:hypothetical protein
MIPSLPINREVALGILSTPRDDDRQITLQFSVSNRTATAVFVRVRPCYGSLPSKQPYTCLSADEKAVNILLGDAPLPSFLSVYVPTISLSALLQPGATYADDVQLDLPVLERTAYQRPTGQEETKAALVRTVSLSTMWHPEPDSTPAVRDNETGLYRVYGPPRYITTAQAQLDQAVEVRVRQDNFERF